MNLIQLLTSGRFNERFGGCFFRGPDGEAHTVVQADNDYVTCNRSVGVVGNLTVNSVRIPADFFDDMARFAVPTLGWRAAQGGRILNRLTRINRGYHRGVAVANLDVTSSRLTQSLIEERLLSTNYMRQEAVLARMALFPEYLTLADGLTQMRRGEILSFVISPDLAVAAQNDSLCALYHKADVVGSVTIDGDVSVGNPFITHALQEAA